jgi:glycine/D-amino acid oxidase-like deaminating enzyme
VRHGGEPSGKPHNIDVTRRSLLLGAGGAAASAPALVRAQSLGSAPVVIVVGAGVFGAWTAERLRRSGAKVTLIDAWGPAHSRASSGGESRMTRAAYGKDEVYTRMASASLGEWKALSAKAELPLFHETGVLFFFQQRNAYLEDSVAVHRRLGLPTQLLTAAEMRKRYPIIDFTGVEAGLFEPQFGALMARRAVQTLVARFVRGGGNYEQANVLPPEDFLAPGEARPLNMIMLTKGVGLSADRYVFACGPWLPKMFPGLLGKRITATRQTVFFFETWGGGLPALPGWADFNGGDVYYGFPDLEGRGFKIAHDAHGPPIDPDTADRLPTAAEVANIRAFMARRFPALGDPPLSETRVCQYENSGNGDFLIDRHPNRPNVVLVGAGSGHGFKHGPEVGRLAAELTLFGKAVDPRFSLATKSETQQRTVI